MEHEEKKSNKLLNKMKNLEIQDYLVIALIVIVFLVQFSIYSQLKQIPGPIYGGDAYHHKGMAQHIYNGNAPWTDPYYLGGYAFYPWLAHVFVVFLAYFAGISILKASIFFPAIMSVLAIIVTYLLGIKVFRNKNFALLFAAAWISFRIVPSSAPTDLALTLMMPAAALFIIYAKTVPQRIAAGIVYGLSGITHAAFFIGINLLLLILFSYRVIDENMERTDEGKIKIKRHFSHSIAKQLRWFSIILLIGIPIAMLYWGPVIFVYHGKTLNPLQEYSGSGLEGLNFEFVFTYLFKQIFFDTSNYIAIIMSILAIMGLYYVLLNRDKLKIALLFYLTAFFGVIHPIITRPLINTSFGYYWFPGFANITRMILIIFGIYLIYALAKKYLRNTKEETITYAIIAVTITMLALNAGINIKSFESDQFTQAGFTLSPDMEAMFRMGDWIMANTRNGDVFVSTHPETSFALQALTGREVMFSRRTHSSHFVDVNKRAADEAVMLYGNSEEKTKELLREYNVKYIYHDFYSLQTKQQCEQIWSILDNPNAQLQSYVCLQTTPEFENYLKQYGVNYKKIVGPLDPAGGPYTPKYELLAVNPSQFNSYILNNSILIHQEFVPQGMIAILYKIK